MVDLLYLLKNDIVNGTFLVERILMIVDGGKLLMEAYLPPNESPACRPSQHKLLSTLTNREEQHDTLRQKVIEIITSTPPHSRIRDGMQTLEKLYMGKLMRDLKGRVDADVALKVIREEIASRIEITPSEGKGRYYMVRMRDENSK
jgi:hypothetical protein